MRTRLASLSAAILLATIALAVPTGAFVAMASTVTTINVPVTDWQTGTLKGPARPVPAGFIEAAVRINCTTGNPAAPFTGFAHPFSDPNTTIQLLVQWSWDGGNTFPGNGGTGPLHGSPTGIWATDKRGNPIMFPEVGVGLPWTAALGYPNFYQPIMIVKNGPVSCGLTILEMTA